MQYAIFSDIHANLTALQTVWAALEADGLAGRTVLNAGDNVGYGPDPQACARFLRRHPNIVSVKGNYDKNVALFPKREAAYYLKWGLLRPDKFGTIQAGSAAISDETRLWLFRLPAELTVTLEAVPVFLTHYAPGSKEGIGTWTPDSRLEELAKNTSAKVVVCGHTHTPFVRLAGGILWVNPGSLGRDIGGEFRYAVLTLEPGQLPSAELKVAGSDL